jgi:CHAT domain-containing protein/tetratricopeptide (TPR) repeat protein
MGTGIRRWMFSVRSSLTLLLLAMPFAPPAAAKSPMQEALVFQQQGKLKEARDRYHLAAEAFRASADQQNVAAALSAAGEISISLGDYQEAIHDAEQAAKLRQALHDDAGLGVDFNTIAMAYESLGNYPAALDHYQEALKINRMMGNVVGEVGRLNNIGNMHFYQARYMDALESYQSALALVNANATESWNFWGRKLTVGNIATLYQRLGLDEQALELYQQISGRPKDMPATEYAQILLNVGVLYRHLGDPLKALEVYHSSQAMFRTARNADGEIRALRNIGIVKTMDLGDLPGALQAFTEALHLSKRSSNTRGFVQASLYLGELLRRLHRYKAASSHLQEALAKAQAAGLVEERWKSLYALGQIAEETGSPQSAIEDYRKAISIIESVRAGIGTASLKIDFLADKRDVYDSLIAFELRQPKPSTDELFQWMERSRARTLQDRVAARTPLVEPQVQIIQTHLPPETLLVELWMGTQESVAVWMTPAASGMVRYGPGAGLVKQISQLLRATQKDGDDWKQSSGEVGARLLAGLPLQRHMIVVQDGPLNIPFEVLSVPGTDDLLIQRSDVSYLPSARLIAMSDASRRSWLWPWNRELVAMGAPPLSSSDALAQNEQWQPLPASADEVRGIARILPGSAETHLGADARKSYLLDHHLEGVPLLHVSTHAVVDPERPERSRILLASAAGNADYLFLDEVSSLDLKGVDLVTLSACDTARGKMVAGEGIQAFSQSFLGAGASATLTSLWKVADAPAADFMKQFYYSLGRGASKAAALRSAKLRFLNSNSALSHPKYWAAFIITGDGWNPTTPVIPWSAIIVALAAILGLMSLIFWRVAKVKVVKREQRKELQFR